MYTFVVFFRQEPRIGAESGDVDHDAEFYVMRRTELNEFTQRLISDAYQRRPVEELVPDEHANRELLISSDGELSISVS